MIDGENQSVTASHAPDSGFGWRFWVFVPSRQFGVIAALLSLVALLFYVFVCAPYQEFLYSDMKKYWFSALTRLDGDPFEDPQFIAWPPLYHIFLAELFRMLRWIGLGGLIRLETALTINIVAFSVSVYALQRLAVQWIVRPELIFVTVLLYALGFPSLYFNAFLLSENLGIPLMVIAVALAIHKQNWQGVLLAGLLFALATIIRPAFGPFGLAFVLFYFARHGISWKFIGRAAAFSAVFFGAVLLASAEVSRISQGKLFGLSGNGGLDFFISMSNYHRIDLKHDGWHFDVVAPAYSWKPENGSFYTNVPFYRQDYYFAQGWKFIERNPAVLLGNFGHVRNLFFADMLPTRFDAPGFAFWRPVWDWFKFGMFLTLGLYAWMWRSLGERKPEFVLMISIVMLTLAVSFIFTGEPRYTYSIIFIFYLLFFKLVEIFWRDRRRWLRPLAIYVALLVVVGSTSAAVIELMRRDLGSPSVRVNYVPSAEAVQGTVAAPVEFDVMRILFPHGKSKPGLIHVAADHPPLKQPGSLSIRTRMAVQGPIALNFEIYSAWRLRMYADGREKFVSDDPDYFTEMGSFAQLESGVYDIEFVIDYLPSLGGFAVNYSYHEPDGWRVRQVLGLSTDRVRFLLPDDAQSGKTRS